VQEPENNIVRGAYYILAAALAGCQTSALPTYDEAYTIPSPKAQLIALRTMQICAEETGIADTVDPLAGSYFVETLTNDMEARIQAEIDRVERMGGIVEAVKAGTIQAEVSRQAYRFEQMILSGEYPKVAVNRHVAPDGTRETSGALELYAFDPKAAEAQVARLRRLRQGRDQAAVDRTLRRLHDEARGEGNLMPPILEAVRAYATLGEMAAALRDVWGEHKEPTAF
jgi:methylmalonyl-CoA mutase N-terminal domain/subunit